MTFSRFIGVANFVLMLLELANGNYWMAFFNLSVVFVVAVEEFIQKGKN